MSELDSVADEVVFAVAESLDADPITLDPLAETIDLDALDSLVRSKNVEVRFEYQGFHVLVCGHGEVGVAPA